MVVNILFSKIIPYHIKLVPALVCLHLFVDFKDVVAVYLLHCYHRMPEIGNYAKEKKMYDALLSNWFKGRKKEEYFVFISNRRNIVT